MTPMRLLPEAEEELRDAARFYEAEQQGLGADSRGAPCVSIHR